MSFSIFFKNNHKNKFDARGDENVTTNIELQQKKSGPYKKECKLGIKKEEE